MYSASGFMEQAWRKEWDIRRRWKAPAGEVITPWCPHPGNAIIRPPSNVSNAADRPAAGMETWAFGCHKDSSWCQIECLTKMGPQPTAQHATDASWTRLAHPNRSPSLPTLLKPSQAAGSKPKIQLVSSPSDGQLTKSSPGGKLPSPGGKLQPTRGQEATARKLSMLQSTPKKCGFVCSDRGRFQSMNEHESLLAERARARIGELANNESPTMTK